MISDFQVQNILQNSDNNHYTFLVDTGKISCRVVVPQKHTRDLFN